MPSAGDKVRASDIMHRIGGASRTTALGAAVTTETTLAIDVAFTLTRQRRVRFEAFGLITLTGAATTIGLLVVRRNATGAPVTTSDTLIQYAIAAPNSSSPFVIEDELLAAGTYAYGVTINISTATNINLAAGSGGAKSASLAVWDMGDA